MLDKIGFALAVCLIFGPILLERLGIISGNWHVELQDALLVIAAVSSVLATYKLDNLAKEIDRFK